MNDVRTIDNIIVMSDTKVIIALMTRNMMSSVLRGHSSGSTPVISRITRIGQKRRIFQLWCSTGVSLSFFCEGYRTIKGDVETYTPTKPKKSVILFGKH